MEAQAMSGVAGSAVTPVQTDAHGEVVEIALLLPKKRADALVALSRKQRQSVGQILRGLIERALSDAE
jgi:hypothetical protein